MGAIYLVADRVPVTEKNGDVRALQEVDDRNVSDWDFGRDGFKRYSQSRACHSSSRPVRQGCLVPRVLNVAFASVSFILRFYYFIYLCFFSNGFVKFLVYDGSSGNTSEEQGHHQGKLLFIRAWFYYYYYFLRKIIIINSWAWYVKLAWLKIFYSFEYSVGRLFMFGMIMVVAVASLAENWMLLFRWSVPYCICLGKMLLTFFFHYIWWLCCF